MNNNIYDVEFDIRPFIDYATDLNVTKGSAGTRFRFQRNGANCDYFLDANSGSWHARHLNKTVYPNTRSLLASPEFANIKLFTSTLKRLYETKNIDSFMDFEGEINGTPLSKQKVREILQPKQINPVEKKIWIVLIDGPAGVGKTTLIESIMVHRLTTTNQFPSAVPVLHVTTRGKSVTSLSDALSTTSQIVRAQYTFDQVPALVRNNLLQVAIDGFDELVDPEGYKDAWYALRDFFDNLICGGPLILAGRDTFFDQQNFEEQLTEAKQQFHVDHIRLSPVSTSNAKSWLKRKGWKDGDLNSSYTNEVLRSGSYTLRPYFLSELAKLGSWEKLDSGNRTPRAFMVERFLEREAELIQAGLEIELREARRCLEEVFEAVSIEMADNQVDAIDLAFLQLETEVAFGEALSSKEIAKLRHKAGSFALLERDVKEGQRRFPHTEISNYFLSRSLFRELQKRRIPRFLRRAVLQMDFLNAWLERLGEFSAVELESVLSYCEEVLLNESSFDLLLSNIGAVLVSSISSLRVRSKQSYSDFVTMDAVVFGVARATRFERLRIQRLDVRESELSLVNFVDSDIMTLLVDGTVVFGDSHPRVHQLNVVGETGKVDTIFDPDKIEEWILRHSINHAERTEENEDALRLLERVCRSMVRQHQIKEHESDPVGALLLGEYWSDIEAVLNEHSMLVRVHGKPTSGARASFLRMYGARELLTGRWSEPQAMEIWNRVGSIPVR